MSYPPPGKRALFLKLGVVGAVLIAAVVAVVLVVSPGASAPADVARSYVTAATRYDADALKDVSCANDKPFVEHNSEHLESFAGSEGENTEFSVGDARIDGDEANVHVTIDHEEYTFTLVREREAWKVCFDFNDLY